MEFYADDSSLVSWTKTLSDIWLQCVNGQINNRWHTAGSISTNRGARKNRSEGFGLFCWLVVLWFILVFLLKKEAETSALMSIVENLIWATAVSSSLDKPCRLPRTVLLKQALARAGHTLSLHPSLSRKSVFVATFEVIWTK